MLWLALKIDTAENTKPYPKSTCGIETREKMKVFKWTTTSTTIPPSDHLLFLVQISRMQSKLILLTWARFLADLQHIIVSWKIVWGHEMLLNDIGNSILFCVFFFLYSVSHLEQEARLQPQVHHEFPRETNHLASSEGFGYSPFFLRVPGGSRTWFPISLEIWLVGRPSPISLRGRRRGRWWIDLLWPAFPLHRCLSFLLRSAANAAGTQGRDVTIWQSARGGWCRV